MKTDEKLMMMNNNFFSVNFWRSFFYILLGSIFFSILFYFRVIRVRVPRELYTNLNWILIIIYICMIGLFIYLIIKTGLTIKNGPKEQVPIKNEYYQKIISFVNTINKYFYESLEYFDKFIKIIMFGKSFPIKMRRISEIIYYNIKISQGRYFSWVFFFFPRIMMSIIFFIDVVYFNYMEYFYKALPLVLIVLLYKYMLYCIDSYTQINILKSEEIITFYEFDKDQNPVSINISTYYIYKYREAHKYQNSELFFYPKYLLAENLNKYTIGFSKYKLEKEAEYFKKATDQEINDHLITWYLNFHKWFLYPGIFIELLKLYKEKIDGPKVQLFTSCIYLLSWSYMLLYGIINIT